MSSQPGTCEKEELVPFLLKWTAVLIFVKSAAEKDEILPLWYCGPFDPTLLLQPLFTDLCPGTNYKFNDLSI